MIVIPVINQLGSVSRFTQDGDGQCCRANVVTIVIIPIRADGDAFKGSRSERGLNTRRNTKAYTECEKTVL